jgi:hypothetical protein
MLGVKSPSEKTVLSMGQGPLFLNAETIVGRRNVACLTCMFRVLNLLRMRSVQHGPGVCLIRSIVAAAMSINGS